MGCFSQAKSKVPPLGGGTCGGRLSRLWMRETTRKIPECAHVSTARSRRRKPLTASRPWTRNRSRDRRQHRTWCTTRHRNERSFASTRATHEHVRRSVCPRRRRPLRPQAPCPAVRIRWRKWAHQRKAGGESNTSVGSVLVRRRVGWGGGGQQRTTCPSSSML